eukprot:9481513-Pyramimonas_sp.AAC.2
MATRHPRRQDGFEIAREGPEAGPRGPERGPREPQDGPKSAQQRPTELLWELPIADKHNAN